MNHKRFFRRPIEASIEVQGEMQEVLVEADYQPAEYDTNTAESVDICSVMYKGWDVLKLMGEQEVDDLKAEILGAYHEACQGFIDVREALREDAAEARREYLREIAREEQERALAETEARYRNREGVSNGN